jgi:hypothetical protein
VGVNGLTEADVPRHKPTRRVNSAACSTRIIKPPRAPQRFHPAHSGISPEFQAAWHTRCSQARCPPLTTAGR